MEGDIDLSAEDNDPPKPRVFKPPGAGKKSAAKKAGAIKTTEVAVAQDSKTKEEKITELLTFFTDEEALSFLLNKLFSLSLSVRRKMIMDKYVKEMNIFSEKLNNGEIESALGEFMREKIEGKLLATLQKDE